MHACNAPRQAVKASVHLPHSFAGSYIANVFDARVLFGPGFAMPVYSVGSVAVRARNPVNILQQEEKLP